MSSTSSTSVTSSVSRVTLVRERPVSLVRGQRSNSLSESGSGRRSSASGGVRLPKLTSIMKMPSKMGKKSGGTHNERDF